VRQTRLKLNWKVDECKPLHSGPEGTQAAHAKQDAGRPRDTGRGLHSSTFRLNLSALYGIGGARRGCVARVQGVFRVCRVIS